MSGTDPMKAAGRGQGKARRRETGRPVGRHELNDGGLKDLKDQHGGKRRGAGMPSGKKTRKTLDKEAAREALRELVKERLRELVDAQVSNAMGIKYLVVRDKGSGKFVRVTENMAKAKLGATEEIVEVWEKDPSVQAFSDLMNRTIDKPAEQEQRIALTVEHLDQKIIAARKRLGEWRGDG